MRLGENLYTVNHNPLGADFVHDFNPNAKAVVIGIVRRIPKDYPAGESFYDPYDPQGPLASSMYTCKHGHTREYIPERFDFGCRESGEPLPCGGHVDLIENFPWWPNKNTYAPTEPVRTDI